MYMRTCTKNYIKKIMYLKHLNCDICYTENANSANIVSYQYKFNARYVTVKFL